MTGEHIRSFARDKKLYVLEFEILALPQITSNGRHGHWRAIHAARKRWKEAVLSSVMWRQPEKPLAKAKLTLTRHSSRECDFDNLVISFKPVIDGLKEARVILDDKSSVIGQSEYRWEKAKIREGKITIRVEEVAT